MISGPGSTFRSTGLPLIPAFLLLLHPLPGIAQGTFGTSAVTQGETLFIEPTSPRANEDVLIHFPQRGCKPGRVDARMKGKEIVIVVNHYGKCFYSFHPHGYSFPGGELYQSYRIGRLPVGNYHIRLYYQDLSESSRSRSFSITESFSVMPAR
ncbi:hypothetical protein [Methylocaldum marinum]|uniref:hypothetical protein n=1 Tax=Methylocaldum marinum TaxID=1432792 RepID=UPI0011AE2942|nr:hypothetical protein [Methylocaldum marinum]